jgi:serine/threonine protein kinase
MKQLKSELSKSSDAVVHFLRKRDYVFRQVLGQGACGQTVLLHDELIGSDFVCKKYVPFSESHRQELFKNFLREIKLLHEVYHVNVVRVFNYYVYPEQLTGYILMEYIDGQDIEAHLRSEPETINELFVQAIEGFAYLEQASILHRDIRPQNILVGADGTLKIIDLGFGKHIESPRDFDKSISLNWWCAPPIDFDMDTYDHSTEVYFVGKLFEKIILDIGIEHFKFTNLLSTMCERDPARRVQTFFDVRTAVHLNHADDLNFSDNERRAYLDFAGGITKQLTQIEAGTKYTEDIDHIRNQLETAYRSFMLEDKVPDSAAILRIFIRGEYYYRKAGLPSYIVKEFLDLLRGSSAEKQRVALANLHSRFDAIKRYSKSELDDDVPF